MPIINGSLELERDAPFEEIEKQRYKELLEGAPPRMRSYPYQNLGWFVCCEPHPHEHNRGEAYHYLCFCYKGKYYAACRSVEKTDADYEWEISAFCRELDSRKISPSRIVSPLGAKRLSKQRQSPKERKKWKK